MSRCLTCHHRGHARDATRGYRTCTPCADRLEAMLTEIISRYTRLCSVLALLPTNGDDGRKPNGFGSQSPAQDHVIALLDPRTSRADPGDPHSVYGLLHSWAELVRTDTNQHPPHTSSVATEVRTLHAWNDWITRQTWVPDLDTELRELRDQLRSATGEPNPKPIGHCINTLDDGDTTRECHAPLYAPKHGTALRCHHCGREYDGLDLVKLELAQEQ